MLNETILGNIVRKCIMEAVENSENQQNAEYKALEILRNCKKPYSIDHEQVQVVNENGDDSVMINYDIEFEYNPKYEKRTDNYFSDEYTPEYTFSKPEIESIEYQDDNGETFVVYGDEINNAASDILKRFSDTIEEKNISYNSFSW